MCKPTPNPPNTDPTAPNENLRSEKFQDPTDRIPSAADIRATPRTLCTMYIIDPQINIETLLGIAQVIMLGELAVNRALDRIAPPK